MNTGGLYFLFLTLLPVTGSVWAEPAVPEFCTGSTDKCGHFGGQPGARGNCALRNAGTLGIIKSEEDPGMENQAMSP